MDYIEALFKDIDIKDFKTNKVTRKAWPEGTYLEAGEHGQMQHVWRDYIDRNKLESHVYPYNIEMLESDWEVYEEKV